MPEMQLEEVSISLSTFIAIPVYITVTKDILYVLRLANYYCMVNFIETCKTNARVLDRQGHCLGT